MINQLLTSIADSGRELLLRRLPGLRGGRRSMEQLCAELSSRRGEAMGTALAREVVACYNAMNSQQREAFYQRLLSEYAIDQVQVDECIAHYQAQRDHEALQALAQALSSPRQRLFQRINMAPDGTATLVALRQDLLRAAKQAPELAAVDADLEQLLVSWFNRGFLSLQAINWRSPAHILEKLIQYEAVHAMNGWEDLRRRLQDDRRCFAFFHPALPDEPLIFVEVALVKGMADNIQQLLADHQPGGAGAPDTAIFYSISNCQPGLKGISFGNFLIKQVVMELRRELPQLKAFATLSPVPGFRRWLNRQLDDPHSAVLSDGDRGSLQLLQDKSWLDSDASKALLKPLLIRLCAQYLANAAAGGAPLDPVARFHLGNGAILQRINWLGDRSDNGVAQSAGILVNYLYDLERVEENHEAFVESGKICLSPEVARELKR